MRKYWFLVLLAWIWGCNEDDGPSLAPAEERVSEAISTLRSDLMAPAQGWRLEYRPTPDAGVFFMLLDFGEDEVTIQSDVVAEDGEFIQQTIPYRIDNGLGLELIFETFGVFHYLFEQDQASFGAEFEFLFQRKDGENLLFESKTDFFAPTQIVFEPASSGDANSFARDLAENLNAFTGSVPSAFIPEPPHQQVILEDLGVSVFWALDVSKRRVQAELAGNGTTLNEVLNNGLVALNHSTGFALRNGSLVLLEPLTFVLNRQQITVNSISLNAFDMAGPSVCATGSLNGPRYRGTTPGLGDVTLISSLLSTSGLGFQPNVFTVNIDFVFDGEGNPVTDPGGIVADRFPNAVAFIFLYGVELVDPEIPIWSAGLIFDDGEIYLREFQPTETEVNRVKINFTNNYYHSATAGSGDQQKLQAITNEIFAGGEMYAFEIPLSGLTLFRLFNPCNSYDVFLVQ